MTPEEIEAKLRELGLKTGGWQDTIDGPRKSPMVEKQKEALIRVRRLLEQQVAQDQAKLAELHEQVNRLRHGGGS